MDRRRLIRLSFEVGVRMDPLDTGLPSVEAKTRDICMTGLQVSQVRPLPRGTRCEISIRLASGDLALLVRALGEVVRCETRDEVTTMGIHFLEMEEESQELLWRVIRHNTPMETGDEESRSSADALDRDRDA